jgi:hypothetical protein
VTARGRGVDPRCRLQSPQIPFVPLPRLVVTAGNHRVTLSVAHESDGDVLRVVIDVPSARVELLAQSFAVEPDLPWGES